MRKQIPTDEFLSCYLEGMTDIEIADQLGCSVDTIRHKRIKMGYEPNSYTTGELGAMVSGFLDSYRAIVLGEVNEDTKEMIKLCEGCRFDECINCFDIIRREARKQVA